MSRRRIVGVMLPAILAVTWGCTTAEPRGNPDVYLARGGFLRFSDDVAMVVDGVLVPDSASAVAMGIRVVPGPLFPLGTLTAEAATTACGIARPVAFLQTSREPVVYSAEVPSTCRPPE